MTKMVFRFLLLLKIFNFNKIEKIFYIFIKLNENMNSEINELDIRQKNSPLKFNLETEIEYDADPKWKLLLGSYGIDHFVQKCADHLNEKFLDLYKKGQKFLVACILKGAVYFMVDLKRKLKFLSGEYHIEASSYHNSQTQQEEIEILSKIQPSKFKDKMIILIDELFDNGNTINNVKNKIIELAQVPEEKIYTCTLFKKNKESNVHGPDYYGVLVPNVWLVGYGLDDQQEKREWKCLYACPKLSEDEKTPDDRIFDKADIYLSILLQLQSQK